MAISGQREMSVDLSDGLMAGVKLGEVRHREEFSAMTGICVAGTLGVVFWLLGILAAFAVFG